jgi:hypothetical protein
MKAVFSDHNNENNLATGTVLSNASEVRALFDEIRHQEPPFFCELKGDNGCLLSIGLASEFGCVQYATADGLPPYWVALGDSSIVGNRVFFSGQQETEISERHCLSYPTVMNIAMNFIETGKRSADVEWEQI